MRKLIASINMTLDGFCDHKAVNPDDEIHQYFSDLLRNSDAIIFGRTTYHLMEYWRTVLESPTDNKAMNDFAATIDNIPKIVFSRTLKNVDWKTARVANRDIKDEVLELKKQSGKDILVGSPSLIIQCMKLNLIDEYQLVLHPIIVGSGLPLFKNITEKVDLKLVRTRTFGSGAVMLCYQAT